MADDLEALGVAVGDDGDRGVAVDPESKMIRSPSSISLAAIFVALGLICV